MNIIAKDVAQWVTKTNGKSGYAVVIGEAKKFYCVSPQAFATKKEALEAIQEALDEIAPQAKSAPSAKTTTGSRKSDWTTFAAKFWKILENGKVSWRTTLKDGSIKSRAVGRKTLEEAFYETASEYYDSYGLIEFKVDESELPVAYKDLLKRLKATKKEVKFV